MKLISYSYKNEIEIRAALVLNELAIDIEKSLKQFAKRLSKNESDFFPNTIYSLLNDWNSNKSLLKELEKIILSEDLSHFKNENQFIISDFSTILIHSPVPIPNSFRDFYAFEQHVKSARKLRNLEVAKEWYDFPVFYFSNHNAFKGPNEKIAKPEYTNELDFELEIACIIGKTGKNIKIEEASNFIAGYSILNDWSARDIQREEMKVGLGPAKGKDFATSMGPFLVTPDEISEFKKNKGYDLKMTTQKNGDIISEGNWADIHYSFEEMIVRASDEVTLYPGDVIGSGTVGTGCILELRPENANGWLESGDEIELEVEKLGKLKNTII
jgi:2-keto-4-pentenoate hydratase/2-oxohepta-3-ene-1,7-dioic acid hydratase in catechol pathway